MRAKGGRGKLTKINDLLFPVFVVAGGSEKVGNLGRLRTEEMKQGKRVVGEGERRSQRRKGTEGGREERQTKRKGALKERDKVGAQRWRLRQMGDAESRK